MAQQVLGTMTDSGSTLTLQGNALRTEDSIVALSNITQIKCVDDTPEYKLPWKLMIVLAVAGLIFFGYVDRAFFMILPAISSSSAERALELSITNRIRSALSKACCALCTPICSTLSRVCLIPAVSVRCKRTPPTLTVSLRVSLVVPSISVTIALSSPAK